MVIGVGADVVLALLLSSVRVAAWLFIAPPFNGRSVPTTVKALLSVALALPMLGTVTGGTPDPDLPSVLSAVAVQAAVGATLGFVTYLLFAAVQAAGDLIDLFGGFSLAMGYDPLSMSQNSVFGRLHQLLAIVLLFAVDGHLLMMRGLMSTFAIVPLNAGLDLSHTTSVITTGVGTFFLAALQIAAPLVGVLVVADLGLGLLSRVSPSLNAFSLGFPLKIMLTLLLVGLTFPLLPGSVSHLADLATRAVLGVARG